MAVSAVPEASQDYAEWKLLWADPVDQTFQLRVKSFHLFDITMKEILRRANAFLQGMKNFSKDLRTHSEAVSRYSLLATTVHIATDGSRLKQATNQIAREDAPHSEIARFQRDLRFNIIDPTGKHVANNKKLKGTLEEYYTKIHALQMAHRGQVERSPTVLSQVRELHTYLAEWLYVFDLHRNDIVDSTVQTWKHLQYDFFALSAHAMHRVLPTRIEFRPLVEMTPEALEEMTKDFLSRPVDEMSLTTLRAQGFDDALAQRALRLCRNDTQAAMDWLLKPAVEDCVDEEGVRIPTSLRLIRKFKKQTPQSEVQPSVAPTKEAEVQKSEADPQSKPADSVVEHAPTQLPQPTRARQATMAKEIAAARSTKKASKGDGISECELRCLLSSLRCAKGELASAMAERDEAKAEACKAQQASADLAAEVARLQDRIAKLEGMESMD
mmetsp:Transcript_9353/g.16918  ORF Transcript_9353/g.16918 Transcript_9353/m.16918 type:complete len:441 (+) Transcript_9353:72-1394(+)